MTGQQSAVASFRRFLAKNGELVTLQTVARVESAATLDVTETVTEAAARVWVAEFARRDINGTSVQAGDLRAQGVWTRSTIPAQGARVVRRGVAFEVLGVMEGPTGVEEGIAVLHLRRAPL